MMQETAAFPVFFLKKAVNYNDLSATRGNAQTFSYSLFLFTVAQETKKKALFITTTAGLNIQMPNNITRKALTNSGSSMSTQTCSAKIYIKIKGIKNNYIIPSLLLPIIGLSIVLPLTTFVVATRKS